MFDLIFRLYMDDAFRNGLWDFLNTVNVDGIAIFLLENVGGLNVWEDFDITLD